MLMALDVHCERGVILLWSPHLERLGPRISPYPLSVRGGDGSATRAYGVISDVGDKHQKGGGGAREIKGIRARRPRTCRNQGHVTAVTCLRSPCFAPALDRTLSSQSALCATSA